MDKVEEIRIIQNIIEYLNFYGVHPKILKSPRIEEWIKQIMVDLKTSNIELIKQALKAEMGKIKYFANGEYHEIRINDGEILQIRKSFDEKNKTYCEETRHFDENGIEMQYVISRGSIDLESKKRKEEEKVTYRRDSEDWRFFIKENRDTRIMQQTFFFRKRPYLLQNIKIDRQDLAKANFEGEDIEAISEMVAGGSDKLVYKIVKECNLASLDRENIVKTYEYLNLINGLDTRYEKVIEGKILGYNERSTR